MTDPLGENIKNTTTNQVKNAAHPIQNTKEINIYMLAPLVSVIGVPNSTQVGNNMLVLYMRDGKVQ